MGILPRLLSPSRSTNEVTFPTRVGPRRPLVWMFVGVASAVLSVPETSIGGAESGPPSASTGKPGPPPGDGRDEAPRVASRGAAAAAVNSAPASPISDPIATARQSIADCQTKFAGVRDYTCTFFKRERIGGELTPPHVMEMKARSTPASIYFKFRTPNKGREAIYVRGRNGGKVVAHDVGIGKFLAGTMNLDPLGGMAMEDCRHPITEAGLGALIETVARHWGAELTREESLVTVTPEMRVGGHPCTMIETVHPSRQPHFLFHKVRLYISHEHGLPIRYEGFDWPKHPGTPPELVEEYTYLDVRLNVGLGERDFDPRNRAYSFGRF